MVIFPQFELIDQDNLNKYNRFYQQMIAHRHKNRIIISMGDHHQ